MQAKHLLFIFSDQHARHVTGCYGDTVVETPAIDRLAREGVRFTSAYCPSPICVPSRMAMLTARWPHRQACWTNDDVLSSAIPTWLHALGAGGIRATLIGRLHALGPDQLYGYGDRLVGEHSPNWPGIPRHSMGVLQGANDPNPESLTATGPGMSAYQAKDRAVTDAAVEWLSEEGARRAANGERFALTVGMMLPHAPYVVDADAFHHYAGRVPAPIRGPSSHPHTTWWRRDRGIEQISAEQVDRARVAYYGLVHRMDEMIGEIVVALERTGLLDETLIVYASDHGDHVGERGLWWKHTFYEESVAVPLVMRFPGALPAGEVRGGVVNLIDVTQTMLAALGAPTLPHADGQNLWDYARGGAEQPADETFSEYCTDPVPAWTGGRAVQQRMIRSGRHKLISYDREPPQLFDLEADPLEATDLADDPAHAAQRDALLKKLHDGWDPEAIAAFMRDRRVEKDLMAAWARHVRPASTHIWEFSPDSNRLD